MAGPGYCHRATRTSVIRHTETASDTITSGLSLPGDDVDLGAMLVNIDTEAVKCSWSMACQTSQDLEHHFPLNSDELVVKF